MKGALKMLESFIPQMVRQFTGLYGGNILIVGLTMESELRFVVYTVFLSSIFHCQKAVISSFSCLLK